MNASPGRTLAAVFLLVSGFAAGQTNTATLSAVRVSGRIVDPSGAPIPNATVTLGSGPGETMAVVHTDATGKFTVSVSLVTEYKLGVDAQGFVKQAKTIDVEIDKEFQAGDIVLSIGRYSGPMVTPDSLAQTQPAPPAQTPPASLSLQGLAGSSATLTSAELAAMPQRMVTTTEHGAPVAFQGVLLKDLLSRLKLPSDDEFRRAAASYYLLVNAKDGYKVVFAWAELDPSFTDRPVYVVTSRDGKPLTDRDGPFQLVVPDDKRPARWIRQVTGIRILQAN
jgi:hypothetical protein